jgi:hypothetical protein
MELKSRSFTSKEPQVADPCPICIPILPHSCYMPRPSFFLTVCNTDRAIKSTKNIRVYNSKCSTWNFQYIFLPH